MRHKEIIMTGPFSAYIVMRQGTALLVWTVRWDRKVKKILTYVINCPIIIDISQKQSETAEKEKAYGATVQSQKNLFRASHRHLCAVELTLEEYETIRLIDWLDCTQEQCADQMEVARTTVQAVYNSARKKLADCLVNGKRLEIRGGNYQLCPDGGNCCGKNCEKRGCRRRRCNNKPGGDCNEDCCNI